MARAGNWLKPCSAIVHGTSGKCRLRRAGRGALVNGRRFEDARMRMSRNDLQGVIFCIAFEQNSLSFSRYLRKTIKYAIIIYQ